MGSHHAPFRRKLIVGLSIGGAVIITVTALAIGLLSAQQTKESVAKKSEVVTYSTSTPSTDTLPTDDSAWHGWPTDPKKIIIPRLGTNDYIQKVGIDQNKQIAVPTNINIAGWFVDSVIPGEQGLSIIDGHIDTVTGNAIFQHLGDLVLGDQFQIEFGNDTHKTFQVVRVDDLPLDQVPDVLFSQDSAVTHQLNLITCSGSYDTNSREFNQRIIVVASLVE